MGPSVPCPLAEVLWLAMFNVQCSCCPIPQAQTSQPDAVSEDKGRKLNPEPLSHIYTAPSTGGMERSLGPRLIPELTFQAW